MNYNTKQLINTRVNMYADFFKTTLEAELKDATRYDLNGHKKVFERLDQLYKLDDAVKLLVNTDDKYFIAVRPLRSMDYVQIENYVRDTDGPQGNYQVEYYLSYFTGRDHVGTWYLGCETINEA